MWYLIKINKRLIWLEPSQVIPFCMGVVAMTSSDETIRYINEQKELPQDVGNLNALLLAHRASLLRYLGITRVGEEEYRENEH